MRATRHEDATEAFLIALRASIQWLSEGGEGLIEAASAEARNSASANASAMDATVTR